MECHRKHVERGLPALPELLADNKRLLSEAASTLGETARGGQASNPTGSNCTSHDQSARSVCHHSQSAQTACHTIRAIAWSNEKFIENAVFVVQFCDMRIAKAFRGEVHSSWCSHTHPGVVMCRAMQFVLQFVNE